MKLLVFVKQIPDPDIPAARFRIYPQTNTVVSPAGSSSVQGLLDSLAVEAALRVKDEYEGEVTVVSLCNAAVVNVVKKPLAMEADELIPLFKARRLRGATPSAPHRPWWTQPRR